MCEIKNCVFKIPSINILKREFEETDDSGKFIKKNIPSKSSCQLEKIDGHDW